MDESDIDWVNNYFSMEHKYVWFSNTGENVTVRSDDWIEFCQDIQKAKDWIATQTTKTQEKPAVVSSSASGLVCKTCSKPAIRKEGINKNGNPYVLMKCSANYKHNWFE